VWRLLPHLVDRDDFIGYGITSSIKPSSTTLYMHPLFKMDSFGVLAVEEIISP
jgi:hypothetical protein